VSARPRRRLSMSSARLTTLSRSALAIDRTSPCGVQSAPL
jgi:hypothetical protein